MKGFVRKVISLLLFDLPLQPVFISKQFNQVHATSSDQLPGWSANATRQQLVYRYWFSHTARHFALLLGLSALAVLPMQGGNGLSGWLISLSFACIISFMVLYLFLYRPLFSALFLPRLETVKETHERKQYDHLDKCRKAQMSNFALTLVAYVLCKVANLNTLQCNDQSAGMIAKLYGVDPGSTKKSLALILGKRQTLHGRKATEIRNQFEEAYSFLETIDCKDGLIHARKIEQKLLVIPG
jgi:hypothetical protein